jgi:hypothetical protein
MSGIIGSKLNIRGSGRIAKLGTDGQVLTSSGPGVQANYEDAAGGGLDWQAVETGATFTAVAGNGYPVNTTAQACTVTLPASASVGDEIIFTDYARNFATNALTIDQNSLNYQGQTSPNPEYDTAGESIHIVYMDATKGWIPTYDGAVADEVPQITDHEYLIVGGGGCGGKATEGSGYGRGGGGAGGYLTNYGGTAISLYQGTTYTITVGTGSSTGGGNGLDSALTGADITDVTAAGGGGGANQTGAAPDGGSGGGGGLHPSTGGSGNTPSTSPAQGFDGGDSVSGGSGGGGGGASEVGAVSGAASGGDGGDGTANEITGSSDIYAGGGGGGGNTNGGEGGTGGGGVGFQHSPSRAATPGADGEGGGGGGSSFTAGAYPNPGDGGNGIVILRVATADKGTPSGEDSSAVDGADTVFTWLVTGSYVA